MIVYNAYEPTSVFATKTLFANQIQLNACINFQQQLLSVYKTNDLYEQISTLAVITRNQYRDLQRDNYKVQ